MDDDKKQRLLNRAYFYLRFRARTEKEIRDYLHRKNERYGYSPALIEEVIEQLRDEKLIDDASFVEAYINTRNLFKPKGEYALRNELLQKGVSKDLIQTYFDENPVEEELLAHRSLEKVWSRYRGLEWRKKYQKAGDYLRRRGFSYDVIKKTIEEMEKAE